MQKAESTERLVQPFLLIGAGNIAEILNYNNMNNLSYYRQKLRETEAELFECSFDCWKLEQLVYDYRKLYQKAKGLEDEEGDRIAEEFNQESKRLKRMLQFEREQLDNLELDVEHYKFMIYLLQRDQ